MAITLADIESLEVEAIRDGAGAIEKQASSMDSTKAGLGTLPIQGRWTGISATAAFGNLDSLGKFMSIHSDDFRVSARGMYGAADGFDAARQVLKKLDAFADDHGFRIDKSSGAVTALKNDHDPSQMDYIVTTAKQVLAAGELSDAQLTRAVGLLDGSPTDSDAGSGQWMTVIGHSYGSTLVGGAAVDGHHLDANNVITVGSPGVLVQHATDLNLAPGAHVFSTRAENDIIGIATYASLGPDPMSAQFGAVPFEAAPGPSGPFGSPTIEAHSSYWNNMDNPALINMGKIIAGRTDVTPPRFTP